MRLKAFKESVGTLLYTEIVERKSISTILQDYTGQVVDVSLPFDGNILDRIHITNKPHQKIYVNNYNEYLVLSYWLDDRILRKYN